jgi:3-oxoacyl-[acyl-carrier-protein] synthase II
MREKGAVWITGVGAATPVGNTYAEAADTLLAGKSGVRPLTAFNVADHASKIAASVEPVGVPPGWNEAEFLGLDSYERMLHWCIAQALHDAGCWERRKDIRIGLVLGLGAEWIRTWEIDFFQGGDLVRRPRPDDESQVERLRRTLGLSGPAMATATACASGNYALALGRRWVEQGWVDVCLAGGFAANLTPVAVASMGNLGALSRRNADPAGASRPFDRDRDGFVIGEGGALFVLESAARARRRGAYAHAELAGCGLTSDAFHPVIPSPDSAPMARSMRLALADAGVNPDDLDYLNAHATSTPVGDRAECRALNAVLGEAVHRVPVSSTKSMTGHLLGGAAAVEVLACLAALERQAIPPTINLDEQDPECTLLHVPHQARPQRVRVAASNSFGFGGCNSCVILKKVA